MHMGRDLLHRQSGPQMLLDIGQSQGDLRVVAILAPFRIPPVRYGPAQMDQQLHQAGIAQDLRPEAVVFRRLLHLLEQRLQPRPQGAVRRDPPSPQIRRPEAVHQRHLRNGPVDVAAVQVDDDPFIGDLPADIGPVDRVMPDQQHIPWPQRIDLVLHQILHLAREQDHDLVEVVKVKVTLLPHGVLQVKIVIPLPEISLLPDRLFRHVNPSFRISRTP